MNILFTRRNAESNFPHSIVADSVVFAFITTINSIEERIICAFSALMVEKWLFRWERTHALS